MRGPAKASLLRRGMECRGLPEKAEDSQQALKTATEGPNMRGTE